ncbi:MAG: hypothetical protein RQ899_11755 [Pseudomonadales bacterium]|nr:hypothetical protein [Pseudomonadales bacterium]
MKKYMAVYIGPLSPEEKGKTTMAEEVQLKGMQAWGRWIEENSNSIVDFGGPLGRIRECP